MLWWDRKFKDKIEEATSNIDWKLHGYMRYVDDGNCIANEMPLGARVENGKVVVKPMEVETDKTVKGDLRSARLIQELANTISECIQLVS